ncbi:fibronectin type III domain-containing protein 1 [Lissotriton helveticus]
MPNPCTLRWMLLCPRMRALAPALPSLVAGLLLLAALLSASEAQERKLPSRPMRMRIRSPDDKVVVRARPLSSSGSEGPRRAQGYLFGTRARSRNLNHSPLKPEEESPEVKHVASESVHVVSMNSPEKSQSVYRASLTKRKIPEETEEEIPEPKDVSVRVMSSQSVLVSWVDPKFDDTKKVESTRYYSVRYREKGESARWDYKQVNNRRTLVDQLMPDTMYEFSARITEGDRHSQWTASVFQRTPESAPTSAPESFDVWPLDGKGTAVSATWEPPADSTGKVKEYIISYAPALKPFGGTSITVPGHATSTTIEGLQPGERYVFKIRAANRRGQGPPSKAFSVAMPGAPAVDDPYMIVQDTLKSITTSTSVPTSSVHTSSVAPRRHVKLVKKPVSKLKNPFTQDGSNNKPKLPLKKAAQIESNFEAPEVTEGNNVPTETSTSIPTSSAPPQRRTVLPVLNKRPSPYGRTTNRLRPASSPHHASNAKHDSTSSVSSSHTLSSASFPKETNKETKDQILDHEHNPSSIPINNEATKDNGNGAVDNDEEENLRSKPQPSIHRLPTKAPSKTPRISLASNQVFGESIHSSKSRKSSELQIAKNHDESGTKDTMDKSDYSPTIQSPLSAPRRKSNPFVHRKTPFKTPVSKHRHPSQDRKDHSSSTSITSAASSSQTRANDNIDDTDERNGREETLSTANPRRAVPVTISSGTLSQSGKLKQNPNRIYVPKIYTPKPPHSETSSVFVKNEDRISKFDTRHENSDSLTSTNHSPSSSRVPLPGRSHLSTQNNVQSKVGSTPKPNILLATVPSKLHSDIRPTALTTSNKENNNQEKNAVVNAFSAKQHSVPSFAGKSASELLDYYRRRSTLVGQSPGRKTMLTPKGDALTSSSEKHKQSILPPSRAPISDAGNYDILKTGVQSSKFRTTSDPNPNLKTTPARSLSTTPFPTIAHKNPPLPSSSPKKVIGRLDHGARKSKGALTKTEKHFPLTPPPKKVKYPVNIPLLSSNSNAGSNLAKNMPTGKHISDNPDLGATFSNHVPAQTTTESHIAPGSIDSEKHNAKDNHLNKMKSSGLTKDTSFIPSPTTTTLAKAGTTPSVLKHPSFISQTRNTDHNSKRVPVLPSLEESHSPVLPIKQIGSKATPGSKRRPILSKQLSTSSPLHDVPQANHDKPEPNSPSTNRRFSQGAADLSLSLKVPSSPIRRPSSFHPRYHSGSRVSLNMGGTQRLRKPHNSSSLRTGWSEPSEPVKQNRKAPNFEKDNTNSKASLRLKETAYVEVEDEEELSAPPILNESLLPQSAVPSPSPNSLSRNLPTKGNSSWKPIASTTILPKSSARTVSPYMRRSMSRHSSREAPSKPISSTSTTTTVPHTASTTRSLSSMPPSTRLRMHGSRLRSPLNRQFARDHLRQVNGNNGRPNLTTKLSTNGQPLPNTNGKPVGQKIINGPHGTKWIVDLNRGLVLNHEGRYLQDSQGKPLRVKLGGDGRTIVDLQGAPLVGPDGLPFIGSGRSGKPLASAQGKPILSLGGKPLIGLEVIKTTRLPTTTPTTTTTTATTTTTTTTTEPTTPEPTTVQPTTEELLMPTCPPGTSEQYDEEGNLLMGPDGLPDCYIEESYSGLETEVMVTTEGTEVYTYREVDEDYEMFETTLPPSVELITTQPSATEAAPEVIPFKPPLVSSRDIAGKERFTAPYVSYISKDPDAPCSLNDALEHFQVESLEELIHPGLTDNRLPPQNVTYNVTVVAVEGCHSFIILDWAKPSKGDFVTGYLVYSASYDDYLRNKWSTRPAGGTNFPIENLKPNTRYYFKVQAKNPYGYAPASESVAFVTESDNPLLIVRPPGGEPVWIPFAFKYDPSYAECYGKQYVKRTWYRKFVGVVLCNSLRYKIYLSDNLRDTFHSIGDSWGRGEDHCQFVDAYKDGRTGPQSYTQTLLPINGYHRQYRQEPVTFGRIGYGTRYYCVGWYECGVPIPGKW